MQPSKLASMLAALCQRSEPFQIVLLWLLFSHTNANFFADCREERVARITAASKGELEGKQAIQLDLMQATASQMVEDMEENPIIVDRFKALYSVPKHGPQLPNFMCCSPCGWCCSLCSSTSLVCTCSSCIPKAVVSLKMLLT